MNLNTFYIDWTPDFMLDGINWNRFGDVVFDFKDEYESHIDCPAIIKKEGVDQMWFFYVPRELKYGMRYTNATDFKIWNRKDDEVGLQRSENEFDSNMTCYPNRAELDNVLCMFYNGNRFGLGGFGLASVPRSEI